VALTGATGFVGRHILDRLRGGGFRIRVLARQPARVSGSRSGIDVVRGSLADRDALNKLVADCDSLVHCAGLTRGVTRSHFNRVNAVGAVACAEAAREAGVKKILLVSSLAAREPGISPYAASKRAGEEGVLEAAEGHMDVTIVRPPAVYGPGDTEMLALFRLMGRGLVPVFGSSDARFSLIYVEDLADAVVAWQRASVPPAGILELDDGQPRGYGWSDVSAIVSSIIGRPVRQIRIPATALALPAALNTAAGLFSGYDPMFSLGKLRELRHRDWVCRSIDSQGIPGWTARYRLAEGLMRTPGWRDRRDRP
jgi:nucleoside-diphosphate-sugar epimerase